MGDGDDWVSCVSTDGAGGGRDLWPRPGSLSGSTDSRPRGPVRHGTRAAGGRHGETLFGANGSDEHSTRCRRSPRSVPTRLSATRRHRAVIILILAFRAAVRSASISAVG